MTKRQIYRQKIILITHDIEPFSGQGKVNFELARFLQKKYQMIFIAQKVDPSLLKYGNTWFKIIIPNQPSVIRYILFTLKVNKIIKKENLQKHFIIANGFTVTLKHDLNICHFVHSTYLKKLNLVKIPYIRMLWQRFNTTLNAFCEKKAFKKAKTIIAVSEKIKNELKVLFPKKQIFVIDNGVDLEKFNPQKKQWKNRAIFVGDASNGRKNLNLVLEAMKKLPTISLTVAGKISSDISRIINRLDLQNRVILLGQIKNIEKVLPKYDYLVAPSLYEAQTLVVLEAMASGLPVLISNQCGYKQKDIVGFIVKNDVSDLCQKLIQIINYKNKNELTYLARKKVKDRSWPNMAKKYIKIIAKTTNEKF